MTKDELYSQSVDDLARRKSTFSNPHNCVKVATITGGVALRDSKNPSPPPLYFDDDEWQALLKDAATGEFS